MDSRFSALLGQNLDELRQIVRELPGNRLLTVASTQSLQRQITAALAIGDVKAANRIFWMDQANALDVWRCVFLWRLSEQVEGALLLKSNNNLIAATAVCRAGFELAVSGLITSGKLHAVLAQIKPEQVRASVIHSNTFPADVERAIFGTRIQSFVKDKSTPEQVNILTHLNRLKRHPLGGEISEYYELLCDLTHPNLGGNRAFFRVGQEAAICRTSQEYDLEWRRMAEDVLDTTLSWTAHAAKNISNQSSNGIDYVRNGLFGAA